MALDTYDPNKVVIVVGGIIISQIADGTFLKIERDADSWGLYTGAGGDSVRSKSNNQAGKFTFTVMQSADCNDELSALAIADEKSGAGLIPIIVKDLNGTSLYTGQNCWNVKPPGSEFAKEATTREWVYQTDKLIYLIGSIG